MACTIGHAMSTIFVGPCWQRMLLFDFEGYRLCWW